MPLRQGTVKVAVILALFLLTLSSYAQEIGLEVQVLDVITKDDGGQELSFPTVVYYNTETEELLVVDAPKSKIIFYTSDLFPFFSLGPGRKVLVPKGLAFDERGYMYVAQGIGALNPDKPKISIFNGAGIWMKDIPLDRIDGQKLIPASIAINTKNHRIYVVGQVRKGCAVLDMEGRLIRFLKPKDRFDPEEPEQEVSLSDVYVDSQGRIYLLSEEMGRVYVYSSDEKLLFKAGQKGGTPGKLSRPRGVAADPNEKIIYIVDYMRHVVQLLDYETGRYIGEVGGRGWGPGWFNYPVDITLDSKGIIYVSDLFNHRVQVMKVSLSFNLPTKSKR